MRCNHILEFALSYSLSTEFIYIIFIAKKGGISVMVSDEFRSFLICQIVRYGESINHGKIRKDSTKMII
jgi:type III secretory pathway component EscT